MSEFVAVKYTQSEKFNLEVITQDGSQFVHVWNNQSKRDDGTCEFDVVVPIIRVIADFLIEEAVRVYIFEVENWEQFHQKSAHGAYACIWSVRQVDESGIIALRTFCNVCLPKMLGIDY